MNGRILLTVILLVSGGSAPGDAAFRARDYESAAREYRLALDRDPRSGVLHYNLATALLHLGRFEEALGHLETAAANEDPRLRQNARYNGGNGWLFPAIPLPTSPERDAQLRNAILAYREALLLDPDDFDAKWNLELAELLLSQPPAGGAGGGGGGGGSGGGTGPDPSAASQDPQPVTDPGTGPQMSATAAEQLLSAAAERDREMHQEKLRRAEATPPGLPDW